MQHRAIPDEELLLPFERQVMSGEWRSYFAIKRECWLATIQRLRLLWDVFIQLDDIFFREIQDLEKASDSTKMLAHLLFIKSHQSIRVAAEVGFATHFTQAWDLTRAAIESAAVAHKLHREPQLAEVWLRKDDGRPQMQAFKDAFERDKKNNLFPDRFAFLAQLHILYSQFSEWGTHTTVMSLAHHYRASAEAGVHTVKVTYTEADVQKIAASLYYLVSAFSYIEQAFNDSFSARLQLDAKLVEMRTTCDSRRRTVAAQLIRQFKIKSPSIFSI